MLRDAARIQSVWPTLEEFGCSGCNAVAPWNNSNRGKYLLNFTRGIKMYQLCMFLPLFHHFPAYSTISIHFPVLTWAKVYYCSENTDSLCIRNKESHLLVRGWKVSLQQIKINHKIWIHHDISMNLCVLCVCVCKRNILCICIMHSL